ncbi:MAG: carnitine dehydratase [Frankiales bacterium]|nr:carnitine dehydratase [Frankiales bacterium]
MTTGPLRGVLVADFSRVLAGPLASMFLADLGENVVKVERPEGGDDTRQWAPPYVEGAVEDPAEGAVEGDAERGPAPMSTYFASVNRNKRSVTLDLSVAGDRALAVELGRRADVFIENFRPGKLAELGLGPDQLHAINPGLVYCSISGFGAGLGAGLPGYDFVVQALGGLMSITGDPDGEPTKVGVALVDVLTGLHATIATLAALRERELSGQGQLVQVNLLSSLLSSLVNQGTAYLNGASLPHRMGNQHPSIAPYETLATADGLLAVAIGNDRQFQTFAGAIGRPGLAADPRWRTNRDRVANRASLVLELESALRARDARSWCELLRAQEVACGPVNDLAEAFRFAEELGLRPVARFEATDEQPAVSTLANPIELSSHPTEYRRRPPALGADSAEVRDWLAGDDGTPLT